MGLCITRTLNQSINVGDAKIKLLKIGQHRVLLHIEAPKEIKVIRTEIAHLTPAERRRLQIPEICDETNAA